MSSNAMNPLDIPFIKDAIDKISSVNTGFNKTVDPYVRNFNPIEAFAPIIPNGRTIVKAGESLGWKPRSLGDVQDVFEKANDTLANGSPDQRERLLQQMAGSVVLDTGMPTTYNSSLMSNELRDKIKDYLDSPEGRADLFKRVNSGDMDYEQFRRAYQPPMEAPTSYEHSPDLLKLQSLGYSDDAIKSVQSNPSLVQYLIDRKIMPEQFAEKADQLLSIPIPSKESMPLPAKPMTIQELSNAAHGGSDVDMQFDRALVTNDVEKVKELMPQMPIEKLNRYSAELQRLFNGQPAIAGTQMPTDVTAPFEPGSEGQPLRFLKEPQKSAGDKIIQDIEDKRPSWQHAQDLNQEISNIKKVEYLSKQPDLIIPQPEQSYLDTLAQFKKNQILKELLKIGKLPGR